MKPMRIGVLVQLNASIYRRRNVVQRQGISRIVRDHVLFEPMIDVNECDTSDGAPQEGEEQVFGMVASIVSFTALWHCAASRFERVTRFRIDCQCGCQVWHGVFQLRGECP